MFTTLSATINEIRTVSTTGEHTVSSHTDGIDVVTYLVGMAGMAYVALTVYSVACAGAWWEAPIFLLSIACVVWLILDLDADDAFYAAKRYMLAFWTNMRPMLAFLIPGTVVGAIVALMVMQDAPVLVQALFLATSGPLGLIMSMQIRAATCTCDAHAAFVDGSAVFDDCSANCEELAGEDDCYASCGAPLDYDEGDDDLHRNDCSS